MDLFEINDSAPNSNKGRTIYTISELNREINALLSGNFPLIWLEGEISNFAQPASKHMYLSLKDAQAQVRGAMFRNRNQLLTFKPQNGMHVLVRARVGLYEPRGEFQIIIEHMEEAGDGALRRAFEALKEKLSTEGLFDEHHKQSIPDIPQRIGIITSPTGAAVQDVLSILQRRFPLIPVLIYPVQVQGSYSAEDITNTIELACTRNECDVLLLVRGGGSLEDLQAFNEESVVRAIFKANIPIITGIGHETDITIADFAADLRAATPSASAELASPDQAEWLDLITDIYQRLQQRLLRNITHHEKDLQHLEKQLTLLDPARQLETQHQKLDDLENRLQRNCEYLFTNMNHRVARIQAALQQFSPANQLESQTNRYKQLSTRLLVAIQRYIENNMTQLDVNLRTLHTVSPLATLNRGYAIVSDIQGLVVKDAQSVSAGDQLNVRLETGQLRVVVDKKTKKLK